MDPEVLEYPKFRPLPNPDGSRVTVFVQFYAQRPTHTHPGSWSRLMDVYGDSPENAMSMARNICAAYSHTNCLDRDLILRQQAEHFVD